MSSRHRPSRSSFRADGAIPSVSSTAHASAHSTMSYSGRGAVSRLATSATTTSPFVRRATSRTGATASTRSLSCNRSRYSRIAGSAPNCLTRICWTVIVVPPALLDRTPVEITEDSSHRRPARALPETLLFVHVRNTRLGAWVTGRAGEASPAQTGRGTSKGHDEVGKAGRPLSAVVAAVDDRIGAVCRWDGDQAAAGARVADGSGQTRSSFPRLWARQASRYSPAA